MTDEQESKVPQAQVCSRDKQTSQRSANTRLIRSGPLLSERLGKRVRITTLQIICHPTVGEPGKFAAAETQREATAARIPMGEAVATVAGTVTISLELFP